MTKEDMVQVLRSVGVNENTVTAMCNAFDMGVAYERDACAKVCEESNDMASSYGLAQSIRARGEA